MRNHQKANENGHLTFVTLRFWIIQLAILVVKYRARSRCLLDFLWLLAPFLPLKQLPKQKRGCSPRRNTSSIKLKNASSSHFPGWNRSPPPNFPGIKLCTSQKKMVDNRRKCFFFPEEFSFSYFSVFFSVNFFFLSFLSWPPPRRSLRGARTRTRGRQTAPRNLLTFKV